MTTRTWDSTMDTALRLRRFVERHRERAHRVAWRLCDDPSAVEDIAQDAFILLHDALDGLSDEELEPWFYTVLVRRAQNHRRWRGVRARLKSVVGLGQRQSEAPAAGDPGLRQRIQSAVQRLPAKQRAAFTLHYLEHFSQPEAADILGVSTGTIKTHLHRAIRSLRADLADLVDEEDTGHA